MVIEAVDLFCGAGGLTRGLLDAGIVVKAGFDVDGACEHAYEHNNGGAKFLERDVTELTAQDLETFWSPGATRLLAGCAPCQPFSAAANAAREGDTEDPRYRLLDAFASLVRACKPELVTMENVPRVKHHKPFHDFVANLKELEYDVWYRSVACTEVGVPQTRKRIVLIASRLGTLPKGLVPPEKNESITVSSAIGRLPALRAGESDPNDPIHVARNLSEINLRRIRASKPGGTWHDWPDDLRAPCHGKKSGASYQSVYARMVADEPSPTITTQFFNFGTGRFGHPEQDRPITPREAAILQSFPDNYQFVKPGEPVYLATLGRMIGNAVPPKLGRAIGKTLVAHVQQVKERKPLSPEHTASAP